MGFTEAEDQAFWPIYRDYNAEMAKLGDERVALIAEYARAYSADHRRRSRSRSRRGPWISTNGGTPRSSDASRASERRCRQRRRSSSCRSSISCC